MPYVDSDHIDEVCEDWKLWRYMSFAKFMNLLMTDNLHFHEAADFTDNFEGTVPEAVKDAMEEEYEEAAAAGEFPEDGLDKHKRLVGILRKNTYLSCWHHKTTESAAMWSYYGDQDGSVAIETNVGQLKRALLTSDPDIHIAEVEYTIFKEENRDENEEIDDVDVEELNPKFLLTREESNTFAPFLYKRESFDFEEEVRAIIQTPSYTDDPDDEDALDIRIDIEGERKYLLDDTDPDRKGYDVPVLLENLIQKIHVSPGSGDWILDTVRAAVKAKEGLPSDDEEIKDLVVKSQLDENPVFGPDSE